MPLDSKHPEASFSPTSTGSLYFRVAEMPKSQDLAIFLWTTTTTTTTTATRPITLPLAHARGVIIIPTGELVRGGGLSTDGSMKNLTQHT